MAAKSNDIHDIYQWIEKVIDSSTSPQQERCLYNLIAQFEKLAKRNIAQKHTVMEMYNQLQVKVINKLY